MVPTQAQPAPAPAATTKGAGAAAGLPSDWCQVEVIELVNTGSGLGFGIIGGQQPGVIVKTILPGGVADADGRLRAGDFILQINEHWLQGVGSDKVANVLRGTGNHVRLIVARAVDQVRLHLTQGMSVLLNLDFLPQKGLNQIDLLVLRISSILSDLRPKIYYENVSLAGERPAGQEQDVARAPVLGGQQPEGARDAPPDRRGGQLGRLDAGEGGGGDLRRPLHQAGQRHGAAQLH